MADKKKVIRNLELFYTDNEKAGQNTVFMIHGNSLSTALYKEQFQDDSLNFRIIGLDLPGHGQSEKSKEPERDYGVASFINIVTEFIQSFQAQNVFLVGHSLGGHICIHTANRLKSIHGLMIMGTPPLTIPPRLDQAFLLNPALEFAFRADLSGEEISKLAASFISRDDANFKHVMDSIQQADPLVRPFIGQSIAMDLKDDEALILKEAKFPVAIVHGMNDPLVNTDYINQLNIKLWRDKIQVIEDASHSPFLENPLAFNKILKEFIDEN